MDKTASTEWVSLGEAAKILGVHPATVRNWADRGELPFRRTPGGHRRFRRADLSQWATTQHAPQPAEAELIVQSALGRILIEMDDGDLARQPWYTKITPDQRETLRVKVRHVMNALTAYLAGRPTDNGVFALPDEVGRDYAATARGYGLQLYEAARGFIFFTRFIIEAIVQLSEAGTPRSAIEWGTLLREVHTFTNDALLGIIAFYESH